MIRLRLDLAYDGTSFHGWATQPGLRTVQDELQQALGLVLRLGEPAALTVAGRTDTGVHATGQVAHLDLPRSTFEAVRGRSQRPPATALVRRLAGVLPEDIVVRQVSLAPRGFDARFSALHRRYRYLVSDRTTTRDPLQRHRVLWHRRKLDLASMAAAAQSLIGEHDFAAFCRPRQGASTIRELQIFDWERDGDGLLVAHVQADAFCHNMVRCLVGACIAVGEGRRPVTWPATALAARRRDSAATVMPAHGLTLVEVAYPDADHVSERAQTTRALRQQNAKSDGLDANGKQ